MHAFLPDTKKPYNLKAVLQSELDIYGIASKASVYNITTSPQVIEEGLIAVHGYGLKVEGNAEHADQAGIFFEDSDGVRTKAEIVSVNEPKTLKLMVPATLTPDVDYYLVVLTQSTVKSTGSLLKNLREVRSEFALKAQTSA